MNWNPAARTCEVVRTSVIARAIRRISLVTRIVHLPASAGRRYTSSRFPSHNRRAAAIDVDRAAGHVAGLLGGKERRDRGEFLGLAHATERYALPRIGN